jgi:His-Xaa-Ser system protein HxsD
VNQICTKNIVTFEEKVFQLETIKRALYRLADSSSFDISCREGEISVVIHTSHEDIDDLISRIRNEVIDQDLRDTISKETANIRTLILANAFSNTGLIES